jgi:hypothetical protein
MGGEPAAMGKTAARILSGPPGACITPSID